MTTQSTPPASSTAAPPRPPSRFARSLTGGVIMDVVTAEQARIAAEAGAVAVMALERVPADIRAQGGIARTQRPGPHRRDHRRGRHPGHGEGSDRSRRGGADPPGAGRRLRRRVRGPLPADYVHHIDKRAFTVPFVCGATNLGEALRRIAEGAAMIRSKGEAGTGDVSEATKHIRTIRAEIRRLTSLRGDELAVAAKELQAPLDLVARVATDGRLPVPLLNGRRRRDAGGCGDDDAAGCRRRLRGFRHLQVRQPAAAGRTRSSRQRRTTRTRPCSPGCPAAWARRWWASASRTCRRRTAWPSAAGDAVRAVSAARGCQRMTPRAPP